MGATAVVFAYHDVGVRCLSVLLAHGLSIPMVVTHRDDPNENMWFASVEKLARAHDLEIHKPEDPGELAGRLARLAPEFIFSFYYRHMLPPSILACARRGAYNMHGSLLPKYRGRVPVNWAVLHGESETGATLHEMVEKPDAGGIVDQMAVPILPDDRALDVFRKVVTASWTVRCPGSSTAPPARRPRTCRKARISAGAGPRMAASTGPAAPGRSTTSCAPSRRPTPGHSRASRGRVCGYCARASSKRAPSGVWRSWRSMRTAISSPNARTEACCACWNARRTASPSMPRDSAGASAPARLPCRPP
jgi:folate-dependent phosphoribosylglycinamide formyltransferase PurN